MRTKEQEEEFKKFSVEYREKLFKELIQPAIAFVETNPDLALEKVDALNLAMMAMSAFLTANTKLDHVAAIDMYLQYLEIYENEFAMREKQKAGENTLEPIVRGNTTLN